MVLRREKNTIRNGTKRSMVVVEIGNFGRASCKCRNMLE